MSTETIPQLRRVAGRVIGPARDRDAYPGPTWDRLAAIKRRYDPTNLFHLNQNIPPGAEDVRP